jgi:hypothetical protein
MSRDEKLRTELGELLWVFIDYLENTDAPIEMALTELLVQIREFRHKADLRDIEIVAVN